MTNVIWGTVQDGQVIPQAPLPEGASVRILLPDQLPDDLQEELAAWTMASTEALDLVERLVA